EVYASDLSVESMDIVLGREGYRSNFDSMDPKTQTIAQNMEYVIENESATLWNISSDDAILTPVYFSVGGHKIFSKHGFTILKKCVVCLIDEDKHLKNVRLQSAWVADNDWFKIYQLTKEGVTN
ncbi:28630_t:CDS:2, partial [Gigaspora margarita]